MHVIAATAHATGNIRALIVVLTILAVAFWKVTVRALLAILAIAVTVTVGTGVMELLHNTHP